MKVEQMQNLSRKLVLTQKMRQALNCFQLSTIGLNEYAQEISLPNPLLDVQTLTYYETELPSKRGTSLRA